MQISAMSDPPPIHIDGRAGRAKFFYSLHRPLLQRKITPGEGQHTTSMGSQLTSISHF